MFGLAKSAVLIIAYNRPFLFSRVLSQIIRFEPTCIYLFFDGGKSDKDWNDVRATRAIAHSQLQNYPGKYKIYELEKNIGCRLSVESALNWGFKFEDFLIVLEDDCLPSNQFFEYIYRARDAYANNSKVMMISGRNTLPVSHLHRVNFVNGGIWGWATWSKHWHARLTEQTSCLDLLKSPSARRFFLRHPYRFMNIRNGSQRIWNQALDSWDYTWALSRVYHGGFTVVPPVNLVKNLGANIKATHKHHIAFKVDQENFDHLDLEQLEFIPYTKPDHNLMSLEDEIKLGSKVRLLYFNLRAIMIISLCACKDYVNVILSSWKAYEK